MKLSTKAYIRSCLVRCIDLLRLTPFAKCREDGVGELPYVLTLAQPFKPSATLESKRHNLREAARCINKLVIRPGEVFSFWHAVGNPNNPQRFMAGRTIHNGEVQLDLGGGLCQASGIIYHIAILAGLEILERHNHSVDLYTEQTRFAPLGTDATVFFGFKDFRFRNTTTGNISMELIVEENELLLKLYSEQPIKERELRTDIVMLPDGRKKVTLIDAADGQKINESIYSQADQGDLCR